MSSFNRRAPFFSAKVCVRFDKPSSSLLVAAIPVRIAEQFPTI
jgi:hypothetical protein